jgi:hypothetical protein
MTTARRKVSCGFSRPEIQIRDSKFESWDEGYVLLMLARIIGNNLQRLRIIPS